MKRVAVLLLCAACSKSPRTHEVAIRNFRFEPGTLSVHIGDTVRWHNYDFVPHSATAAGVFDTGEILPDSSKSIAVPSNAHDYICTIHPNMKGVLQIR